MHGQKGTLIQREKEKGKGLKTNVTYNILWRHRNHSFTSARCTCDMWDNASDVGTETLAMEGEISELSTQSSQKAAEQLSWHKQLS